MGSTVSRIQVLPEELANKIAAGEVVERPASVIKELVENALDAGAGSIVVEIRDGGRRLISVEDDGEGMGPEDALLAFQRHATSKIARPEDLYAIRTLGFRGEALPSIAAVSLVTLTTRRRGDPEGFRVDLEGGVIQRAEAAGCPVGTGLVVRDLFFNMPARRKFLRGAKSETDHIAEVVGRAALGVEDISFRLSAGGRELFRVSGNGGLKERIAGLFGRSLLETLIPVERTWGEMGLKGWISRPDTTRATAREILVFINGRPVRDRVVLHALLEAFRFMGPRDRYPVAVLFLEIPPSGVDVNVHPAKHEVRFVDGAAVHQLVSYGCRAALEAAGIPEAGQGKDPSSDFQSMPTPSQRVAQTAWPAESWDKHHFRSQEAPLRLIPFPASEQGLARLPLVGQFHRSYIVLDGGDELILVDQHAAHERIVFHRLQTEIRRGTASFQRLLVPQVVELPPRKGRVLEKHMDSLRSLGVEVELFGEGSAVVKGLPPHLKDVEMVQMIRDLVDELAEMPSSRCMEQGLDRLLIVLACHGAVRAGQTLEPDEMRHLLEELDRVPGARTCPHGRPVVGRFPLSAIEKMFHRR
ncbi:MAG: DNA mismatch repair endonuclease MutL [Deltaproteobacteria bacterium]|nr:DNA mismatch repair endonuclease MutL [Deltaproteobacteria bacterium]